MFKYSFINKLLCINYDKFCKLIINLLYGFMCDNMVKEIKMSAEEAIEYVRENVQIRDILEISYNRIFAPGEVLNIISEDEETGEGLRVSLQLNGEILNQVVDVDFKEIKDDLLELRHIKGDKITIVEVYD